jgi:hypothetical protein
VIIPVVSVKLILALVLRQRSGGSVENPPDFIEARLRRDTPSSVTPLEEADGKDNAAQYAQAALPLSKLEEWSRVTEGRDD